MYKNCAHLALGNNSLKKDVIKKILTFCKGMQTRHFSMQNKVQYLSQLKIESTQNNSFIKNDLSIKPFRVSIEGNIGAGKSTLINYFSAIPGVETHSEPLSKWRDLHGINMLELLYKDIQKWYNVFQTYVQLTRLQIQVSPVKNSTTSLQMFERSVQNGRYCFVEQASRAGLLSEQEYVILEEWYSWINDYWDINLDLIEVRLRGSGNRKLIWWLCAVYLQTSPDVVFGRMKRRQRPEEEQVPMKYLEELHESHEQWLIADKFGNEIPVLVVDANKPLPELGADCERIRMFLLQKMSAMQTDKLSPGDPPLLAKGAFKLV